MHHTSVFACVIKTCMYLYHHTSTFALDDYLLHLCYALPIIWGAIGTCLDVDLNVERSTSCTFIENLHGAHWLEIHIQNSSLRCNTLTTHCNTLQHSATLCHTLQHSQHSVTPCNTLQHPATLCNTLQHLHHSATLCNTPQPIGNPNQHVSFTYSREARAFLVWHFCDNALKATKRAVAESLLRE